MRNDIACDPTRQASSTILLRQAFLCRSRGHGTQSPIRPKPIFRRRGAGTVTIAVQTNADARIPIAAKTGKFVGLASRHDSLAMECRLFSRSLAQLLKFNAEHVDEFRPGSQHSRNIPSPGSSGVDINLLKDADVRCPLRCWPLSICPFRASRETRCAQRDPRWTLRRSVAVIFLEKSGRPRLRSMRLGTLLPKSGV